MEKLRLLSLFSGCGGMDLGFEGGFIVPRKSVASHPEWIAEHKDGEWVRLRTTRFSTVFANDILPEAERVWRLNLASATRQANCYHTESIVDLVKRHHDGERIFPEHISIVTGGFPCQDFSVAGKRRGFDSARNHDGTMRAADAPTEETRGKLYYWMKQVVDIVKPAVFVAENVKGLVNLGHVKEIIQSDFSSADGDGYFVLPPQVLHAANFGVPQSRERVIFIGLRKSALRPEILRLLEKDTFPEELSPYPHPTHACTAHGEGLLPPVVLSDIFSPLVEPAESSDESQRFYSRAKYMGTHCQGQKEVSLNKIGPTIRSEHHGNIEFRRLSAEHGGKHAAELAAGLAERRLTPRECALIQSFPPDFKLVTPTPGSEKRFFVSASAAYKVVGNAVPPLLAYHLAKHLEDLWDKLFHRP